MRELSLARLASGESFDVLILGGGVNGAAVLRELALNGVSALLVDRSDFCKGASGASSRMAHGGLRYLENREFKLVAESSRERNLLLKNAPHFTAPLETVVPTRTYVRGIGGSVARFLGFRTQGSRLSALGLNGALYLYEFLGRVDKNLPSHRTLLRRRTFPSGLAGKYRAVVSYFDARIRNPEALVMEMLEDALSSCQAVACLNHMDWTLDGEGRFALLDKVTGQRFIAKPRLVINATGAWVDRVNSTLGMPTRYIRPVKGAHLLIRHDALFDRMAGRAFYFDDGTGRMVISYPLDRTVLLGTTELQVDNPDDDLIADEEIDYLTAALTSLFDDITIDRSHVVSMTTGIRPLQSSDENRSANQANRDHRIAEDRLQFGATPVLSLIGGKWTTFRAFAEQAAQAVLAQLGVTRLTSTRDRSYPGAVGLGPDGAGRDVLAAELVGLHGLAMPRALACINRYGAIARDVCAHCANGDDLPLSTLPDYTEREIEWLVVRRAAVNLDDLLLRRTQLVLDGRCSEGVIRELSTLLARIRHMPDHWAISEAARCLSMPTILPFGNGGRALHG